MDTRIFRVTHDDGGWLNAELRTDINDGFVIIEARESFGESVVSCEQLPDDHPAVRRHTEQLVAESKGVPVNTGGPALSVPEVLACEQPIRKGWNGMTLRDHFAAKAMQGLLARQFTKDERDRPFVEWVVEFSFEIADAMIVTRGAA